MKKNWLVVWKIIWAIWQIFIRTLENVKIDILTKLYVERKKYWGVMFDGTQDWYKVWRKTDLCFQKSTWGIWQIFTRALESLQIGALMAYFYLKLKMYELNNYRGVLCHDNEYWCKNWWGIDLWVQNWYEEYEKL